MPTPTTGQGSYGDPVGNGDTVMGFLKQEALAGPSDVLKSKRLVAHC